MSKEVPAQSLPIQLQQLNPPQMAAVKHNTGPILVLAGAGTGKTRVLTRRVAHLVLEHHVRPNEILAVTFTNKATQEMRHRLDGLLGRRAAELWVATFHSAGLQILRRNAKLLKYSRNFSVYDDQDTRTALKGVLKDCQIDPKQISLSACAHYIDRAKNSNRLPEQCLEEAFGSKEQQYAEVYDRYQRALVAADAMDFGDLLFNTWLLLQQQPQVLSCYQQQLRYILVDEFQDTNQVQYAIVKAICQPRQNLFVVGDDDQSIYSFRGATISNILSFKKDFPQAVVVTLEQNYRSGAGILEAAHAVIEKNPNRMAKKLWTGLPTTNPVLTFVGYDESEEAAYIATELQTLIATGISPDTVAVFYRTNAQSRALEEALLNAEIPYRIFGGLKFYDRKEIKDILAYLRLVLNPQDDQAMLRSINNPPRGIGAQSIKLLSETARSRHCSLYQAAQELAPQNGKIAVYVQFIEKIKALVDSTCLSELVERVIEDSGYRARLKSAADLTAESRMENLLELINTARGQEAATHDHLRVLSAFLDRASLTSSAEDPAVDSATTTPTPKPTVSLMTLHLAKGLEFPVVFLSGMEEGLLPHYRSLEEGIVDEERRLCYVGITRAMQRLYLTRARRRGMFAGSGLDPSNGMFRNASRFLMDIPPQLLENRGGGAMAADAAEPLFIPLELEDFDLDGDEADLPLTAFPAVSRLRKKKKRSGHLELVTTADSLRGKKIKDLI